MKILILHPGALGDIILSLPALKLIRKTHPHAWITLAGNSDFLGIVDQFTVDQRISLSGLPLHRLYGGGPIPDADRKMWASYDQIIAWTGAWDPQFERNLKNLQPHAVIGAWKPHSSERRHVSQLFADSLYPGITRHGELALASIAVPDSWIESGRAWLSSHGCAGDCRPVVLHPGAGNLVKRWPAQRFENLAGRLGETHRRRIILIEGPAEPGLALQMSLNLPANCAAVAAGLSVLELASVLSCCGGYVGSDSGITHLAAALGLPTVAIFGPTESHLWAPRGEHVSVLQNAACCVGCAGGREARHTCLENITVETVLESLLCREGASIG